MRVMRSPQAPDCVSGARLSSTCGWCEPQIGSPISECDPRRCRPAPARLRPVRSFPQCKTWMCVTRLNQQRLKHGVPRGFAARALPMMRDHASWPEGRHEWRRGRCAAPGALIPASCRRVAAADSRGMRSGPQGRRRTRHVLDGNPRIVGPSIHRGVLLAERHAREDRPLVLHAM